MALVRIEDETVVYEFDAERIAGPVSTRLDPKKRQRARWMEAELFRRDDDAGYVFYQVNFSTVWHYPEGAGHVRTPAEISSAELPARPVYCGVLPARPGREQCPPLTLAEARHMRIPALVVAEYPQRRVWRFPDRDSVIQRLVVANHRGDGASSAAVSEPMRELLRQAAEHDPAFRDAIKPVVAL